MADNVNITLGDGTGIVGSDKIGGVDYQRVKLIQGADGVNDGDISSAAPLQVTLANGTVPTHAVTQSGTWTVQPGNTANSTAWKVDGSAVTQPVSFSAGATNIAKAEDVASQDADVGVPAMVLRRDTSGGVVDTAGTAGDYQFMSTVGGRLATRTESRFFDVAATTLTRPANTTAYAVNDSISDNATAGSVTALSASLSDINDDLIMITEIIVDTTDTGLATAGNLIRAYLYNSNPTSSSGVQGGDNAAFSNKRAGLIGTFQGAFTAMFDGGKARLVPESGSYVVTSPTSGAKTLFIQYQTLTAFTPSANSTTLIGNIRGIQGRA